MSGHLRMTVRESLNDLVSFFEQYSDGNSYNGGLDAPLSTLRQPIVIKLVSSIIYLFLSCTEYRFQNQLTLF